MFVRNTMLRSLVGAWLCLSGNAFAPKSIQRHPVSTTSRNALWRHWIPEDDTLVNKVSVDDVQRKVSNGLTSAAVALAVVLAAPTTSHAVSGGGLDYANLDITGQDFSNGNYKGKDFTQVIAKGTTFANSNLQGCRFYKAFLVNADFSGADMRGASLEDTSMDGASLKDANAGGAYFSASLLESKSLENADFTDAQIPIKTLTQVCEREDVKGTNPTTGADTRDSLMCP